MAENNARLDQSLDSILAARKKNSHRRNPLRRRAPVGAKAAAPPVGGVKKAVKPAKKTETLKATAKPGPRRDSKIIVSNLPSDVSEAQIKDYFTQSVGPTKSVILSYNQNGQSRGIANITFGNGASAAKAYKELNSIKVDGRPMKIEVIVDGRDAPAPPEAKKLADRITQPKNAAKPRPATTDNKNKKAAAGKAGAGQTKGGRGKRPAARTKKTAEELDAEMTDYFQAGTGGAAPTTDGGAVQPAGDAPMADDI